MRERYESRVSELRHLLSLAWAANDPTDVRRILTQLDDEYVRQSYERSYDPEVRRLRRVLR